MKKIIITLIFAIFTTWIFAQKLPVLSKQQMYADFDTLYMTLTKICPYDYVRRTVNKYSMSDSILSLKKNIDTITSTESFFLLINRTLTYVQDAHISITNDYSRIDSLYALKYHSTIADTSIINIYDKLYWSKVESYKLRLPIEYINGEYRVLCDFKYKDKIISYNSVITTCNNQNIHKYVNQLLGTVEMMHWDFENKRFYEKDFTKSSHLSCTDSIQINFSYNGKNIEQSFLLNDTVILSKPLKYWQNEIPKVLYFPNDQILYIRMPVMYEDEINFYLHKIDSVSKNNIKKIVIDVRDNPGGSDKVWRNILKRIIDKPIMRNYIFCANINNPNVDFFELDEPLKSFKNDFIKENIYQIIWEEYDTLIEPDTNSLHFKGKIYIIENENCFSSANGFTTTCLFSDQLISIGNVTGWFAGFGISPWVFILPNSKILYQIEPIIDLYNITKPEDIYQNSAELPINLTIDDYNTRYNYSGDWYDKEFLYKYDKVFKTILEQN